MQTLFPSVQTKPIEYVNETNTQVNRKTENVFFIHAE